MTEPAPFSRPFEAPPADPEAQAAFTRAAREPAAQPEPQATPQDLWEDLVGLPEPLREAKAAIGDLLRQQGQDGPAAAAAAEPGTTIAGVAIGRAGIGSVAGTLTDAAPGTQVLTVYTTEPTTPERVRSLLVARMGARAAAHVPLQVVHSGAFQTSSHRTMERPAPGGVSVHHLRSAVVHGAPGVTAFGTLGCLARGATAPRNSRVLALSCNHVLTNYNTGLLNDCIIQPSPGDGGSCPTNQVAILERFIPVVAGGGVANFVDCAVGWAWPDRVRKEIVYEIAGVKNYFRIAATPPDLSDRTQIDTGSWVGKSGRSTGLTYGVVQGFGADATLSGYWGGFGFLQLALFSDVVLINPLGGQFSQPGDSGAVVFMADGSNRPLGVLIGMTPIGLGVVCKMDRVLSALDIVLEV